MAASRSLTGLLDALEKTAWLDRPGKAAGKAVRGLLPPGKAKDALSGTWLGHAAHPPLTDVVIGCFLGVSLLDFLEPDGHKASERLLEVGLAAALPTALTGASDWADTEIADAHIRRIGLMHADANVAALALYATSLAARRRGSSGTGRTLALAGAALLTASGLLGGHMSFTRGVGVNQTAFDPGPADWTTVTGVGGVSEHAPAAGLVGDTPVLLMRRGNDVHAMHDRCSHRGCSLSEGDLDGHVITCPCHGSRFDVRDGSVLRGPATAAQPVLEAREAEGRIEVRLRRTS